MNAFITGSHAYGTPRPDSDIDLAVMLSDDAVQRLREKADALPGSADKFNSLRFGMLNLICLSDRKFAAWKDATEALIARRPVTREEAIDEIDRRL